MKPFRSCAWRATHGSKATDSAPRPNWPTTVRADLTEHACPGRWPMAAVGICPRPRGLAVSAPNGPKVERLWVACGRDGLFASDDLGVNFFRIAGISNALTIAAARSTPGQIAVTTPQVVVTKNAGATWFLSGLTATAVAIDPRDPSLVFATGNNGQLYASLDGGKSF